MCIISGWTQTLRNCHPAGGGLSLQELWHFHSLTCHIDTLYCGQRSVTIKMQTTQKTWYHNMHIYIHITVYCNTFVIFFSAWCEPQTLSNKIKTNTLAFQKLLCHIENDSTAMTVAMKFSTSMYRFDFNLNL